MRAQRTQAGLIRGCVVLLVLLGAFVAGSVWLTTKILATPNLGAAPRGPAHGIDETSLAISIVTEITPALVQNEHAEVVLNEADLTLLAALHNPDPQRYRDPQARIRNGQVVISSGTQVGPLNTTAVAWVTLTLDSQNHDVVSQVTDVQLGQLDVPSWARGSVDSRGDAVVSMDSLLANSVLKILVSQMDCLKVGDDGLHLGFHRPGVTADPSACG